MNLEQTIHARWADHAALAALLPVERVSTGRAVATTRPYAIVAPGDSRTVLRTNAGDALDEVTLRIHVWHDHYDLARAILRQIKVLFDQSDFPLSGGRRVVQMRCTRESATQHDDGTWQMTAEFLAQVYLPSGG